MLLHASRKWEILPATGMVLSCRLPLKSSCWRSGRSLWARLIDKGGIEELLPGERVGTPTTSFYPLRSPAGDVDGVIESEGRVPPRSNSASAHSLPFLRFILRDPQGSQRICRWRVLPFGLVTAPSPFTKLLAPVVAQLHLGTMSMYLYIDEIFYGQALEKAVSLTRDVITPPSLVRFRDKSSQILSCSLPQDLILVRG